MREAIESSLSILNYRGRVLQNKVEIPGIFDLDPGHNLFLLDSKMGPGGTHLTAEWPLFYSPSHNTRGKQARGQFCNKKSSVEEDEVATNIDINQSCGCRKEGPKIMALSPPQSGVG